MSPDQDAALFLTDGVAAVANSASPTRGSPVTSAGCPRYHGRQKQLFGTYEQDSPSRWRLPDGAVAPIRFWAADGRCMLKEVKTATELEAIILRETGISAIACNHPELGWTATATACARGFKEIKKRLDEALPDLRTRYTLSY